MVEHASPLLYIELFWPIKIDHIGSTCRWILECLRQNRFITLELCGRQGGSLELV